MLFSAKACETEKGAEGLACTLQGEPTTRRKLNLSCWVIFLYKRYAIIIIKSFIKLKTISKSWFYIEISGFSFKFEIILITR